MGRKRYQNPGHPGKENKQADEDCNYLWNKGQGKFLKLCYSLEKTDNQSYNHADEQDRCGYHEYCFEYLCRDFFNYIDSHWKLLTIEPMTRFHPSTSTKSSSLNGSDINIGGSIIMPIQSRTLATTMSITRKGKYMRNPISNAVFNSLIAKAGTTTFRDSSAGLDGLFSFVTFKNKAISFCLVCFNIKLLIGGSALLKAS